MPVPAGGGRPRPSTASTSKLQGRVRPPRGTCLSHTLTHRHQLPCQESSSSCVWEVGGVGLSPCLICPALSYPVSCRRPLPAGSTRMCSRCSATSPTLASPSLPARRTRTSSTTSHTSRTIGEAPPSRAQRPAPSPSPQPPEPVPLQEAQPGEAARAAEPVPLREPADREGLPGLHRAPGGGPRGPGLAAPHLQPAHGAAPVCQLLPATGETVGAPHPTAPKGLCS